jgi:hypothetical protein
MASSGFAYYLLLFLILHACNSRAAAADGRRSTK